SGDGAAPVATLCGDPVGRRRRCVAGDRAPLSLGTRREEARRRPLDRARFKTRREPIDKATCCRV
ncbi:MAG: hypothetical protein ACLP1X_15130, partial [Polyangiaceae bacterium]